MNRVRKYSQNCTQKKQKSKAKQSNKTEHQFGILYVYILSKQRSHSLNFRCFCAEDHQNQKRNKKLMATIYLQRSRTLCYILLAINTIVHRCVQIESHTSAPNHHLANARYTFLRFKAEKNQPSSVLG